MGMHGSGYFWMPSKELSLLLVSGSLSQSPGQSGRTCHHPCLTSEPKSSERQGDFPNRWSTSRIQTASPAQQSSFSTHGPLAFPGHTRCQFPPLYSCNVSLAPPTLILPFSLSLPFTLPPPLIHTHTLSHSLRHPGTVCHFLSAAPCGADLPSWPEQLPLQDGSWCF